MTLYMTNVEQHIRTVFDSGDLEQAATLSIDQYGPEVFGLLASRFSEMAEAEDVFSMFCEELWRGLDNFKWQCSMRTWTYTLARYTALRYLRNPERHRVRNLPLSQTPEIYQVAKKVRTRTAAYLRTESKDGLRELRETLPPEDQELLILRLDRQLSWRDLAIVMADEDNPLDSPTLEKESRRLRKRYERVKDKLKSLARESGLISN
jgi:RNA polymerase sigma-70 factor (ECF subfamily)